MRFQASLEFLPQMLGYVGGTLDQIECTNKERHQIELSLEEALVNIINYAYPEKRGEIEIDSRLQKGEFFEIIIKDWGVPFNPETISRVPLQNLSLEERKVGGLGVYFMYQLMDEVTYKREGDANILSLVKQL